MSNMSYCMFENTANDMEECIEALDEAGWDLAEVMDNTSSDHERRGIKRFLNLCLDVADSLGDENHPELS